MKPKLVTITLALLASAFLGGQSLFADPTELPKGKVGEAYSYVFTINPTPADGTVFSATGLPNGLSINASTGEISGTPTTANTFLGTITLSFNGEANNLDVSILIEAAAGTPNITSSTTASGTVGQAFSYTIVADNSPTSYNVDGDLPAGVTDTGSSISGTPTSPGTFPVQLSANNGSGEGPATTLTITIEPAGEVPVITSSATLSGDADELLSYQIVASNTPTSYNASGLPLGVTVNTDTGFVSGTPTIEGTYTATLTATNEFGSSSNFTLTIVIGNVPQISSNLAVELDSEEAMDYTVTASNSPTSFTVSNLPNGLSFNTETRKIAGTPSSSGTYNVTLSASNAVGDGPEATLVITVAEGASDLDENLSKPIFGLKSLTAGNYLTLTFTRSKPAVIGISYHVETSEDLAEWTDFDLANSNLEITAVDNQNGTETITVLYPEPNDGTTEQFIRYKLVSDSP